jgi:hypothetical protein
MPNTAVAPTKILLVALGENGSARDIEAALLALIVWRMSDQQRHHDQRQRRINRENILPAEFLRQPAAQHRSSRCGERGGRCPNADGAIALFLWEGRADQRQACRRDDRCGDALHHPCGDQPFDRRRENTSHRRRGETEASVPQHARLAIGVSERATD